MMINRLALYARLVRLDRPIGIYLLLWPTLWALWIAAQGLPPADVLLVFVAGTVLMRSAGCAINDFADRKVDGLVERTRERPLATGALHPVEALLVFALLSLVALTLVWQLNRLTLLLSVPAVLLAASYPFAKRYTHLPQAHLGLAFAWGVPMAFAAVRGEVPPVAWGVFAATVLWTIAYDTFYAMVDRDDDRLAGIKSTALLFGRHDRAITAGLQLLTLLLLAGVGWHLGLGWPYGLGWCMAAGLAARQQWQICQRERAACFRAFLANHWFGMAIFVGLATDYALA